MAPTLLKAFKCILEAGKMRSDLNIGEIVLIPKNGDHSCIGN
jgi:hypothetical protein